MATWRAAQAEGGEFSEDAVREALERLDPLWEELFPAEQARIVQLLVHRIDLRPDGLELQLRAQGLGHVVQELGDLGGLPPDPSSRDRQGAFRRPQARRPQAGCSRPTAHRFLPWHPASTARSSGDRPGVAEDAEDRTVRNHQGNREGRADQSVLRQPGAGLALMPEPQLKVETYRLRETGPRA